MNKKLIAVLCVALLVLSMASARILNFGLGGLYGFNYGAVPTSEDGATKDCYKNNGLALDSYFSISIGKRGELYVSSSLSPSEDMPFSNELLSTIDLTDYSLEAVFDFRSHLGYEHAVMLDPFRLSVGACGSLQLIMANYIKGDRSSTFEIQNPAVVNLGFGLTAKAEFPVARHLSLYVKGEADYFGTAAYTIGAYHYPTSEENDGIQKAFYMNTANNFSFTASAGLVFFF